ncbi:MAG: HAMP domain-containing histidine kinase [Clostridia bacterium]|nr:HAMP domain-containing histidine kinase [Clostridia bacterium]
MKSDGAAKELKKIKRLKSVNRAMWWYFCSLAILLTLLIELVFFIIVSTTFENQARERISHIGKEVEAELNIPMGLENSIYRNRREGVNVVLVSRDWQVVAPRDYDEVQGSFEEIKDRLESLEKIGMNEVFRSSGNLNYISKVEYGGKPHYLVVSYSLKIVQDTVGNLQLYLLLIGVSVIILAFLVSAVFSRRLTSGLKIMSDNAVRLAKRDYAVEFNNADYKELAQLSDTLNYVRDEVKKSEDFQREILANVTHDLKTPLTMIKAYASMIKEISGDDKQKREKHLQVIIDEADRLTGLVNDVLNVSKLQSNITELNLKVFNLTELVYGIINKFGYLQESQGYNLMVDIDADVYTRADEEKIKQVIYNLLGNAANYTGQDKTVYISLKSSMDGKRVKFSVRDTGKGIAKDQLPEIWNRYYRVKENHTRPVKGTGLGLNIVKAILESHSFDFGVESEQGKGSCFWVDFPAIPPEIEIK